MEWCRHNLPDLGPYDRPVSAAAQDELFACLTLARPGRVRFPDGFEASGDCLSVIFGGRRFESQIGKPRRAWPAFKEWWVINHK